jgi:tetratricopeptide (TPR) repeat protein
MPRRNDIVRYPVLLVFDPMKFWRHTVLMFCLAGVSAGATGASGRTVAPAVEMTWQTAVASGIQAATARDYPASETALLRAAQLCQQFPGGDARIGTTFNTLGLVYKEEKKFPEAQKAFEKALDVLQKAYGPDSLDVGNVSFNLAGVLIGSGHYDAAMPYVRRSQVIYEKILGKESQKMASTLCMVGEVYRNLKQYYQAEAPLRECADAREASGGVENAELGDALYSLGLVYEREGKYAAADSNLRLAEKIRELTAGISSPGFADVLEAHSVLLRQMGRDKEAERDETMAAAIRHVGKNPK